MFRVEVGRQGGSEAARSDIRRALRCLPPLNPPSCNSSLAAQVPLRRRRCESDATEVSGSVGFGVGRLVGSEAVKFVCAQKCLACCLPFLPPRCNSRVECPAPHPPLLPETPGPLVWSGSTSCSSSRSTSSSRGGVSEGFLSALGCGLCGCAVEECYVKPRSLGAGGHVKPRWRGGGGHVNPRWRGGGGHVNPRWRGAGGQEGM